MKWSTLSLAVSLSFMACNAPVEQEETMTYTYPETRRDAVVDTFFGVSVEDPYRWLEDDLDPATRTWIEAQNELTFAHLQSIPFRKSIRERVEKVWNYEKYSAPFKEGNYTYFYKNDGLQNQSVLYRVKEGQKEPQVFLDPNTFSEDGTTSLAGVHFSSDGSLMAYQISEGGSDWRKVVVIETENGKVVDDTLKDVKFSAISWLGNKGFFYSSYDKPKGSELSSKTAEHKLYYHELGKQQTLDKLVFGGSQNPRRYIGGEVTEDEKYLVISAANTTTGNELFCMDLTTKNAKIRPLFTGFDYNHDVVHSEGDNFYILTSLNAPNRRLIKINVNTPDWSGATEIIPETDMPLNVSTGAGKFFASYLKDALSYIVQFDTKGVQERIVPLPGAGTASGFSAKWEENQVYFSFTDYTSPSTLYAYNPNNGEQSLYIRPQLAVNTADYTSYQVFYTSKDGTRIPMMISHKKDLKKDGTNPTILYGYGGFNISLTPVFSPAVMAWMEEGGVYAVANLRGGGEYGKAWHDAGTKLQKQNVFDDFIAAAEWLQKEQYTSPQKLAISGGSNGGLLVGACMTQRPDLFAVALPAVGVLDMLRYHTFTAGAGWAYDYGTAEESEEMFKYLLAYSPVHNARKGKNYPATLITTGDHDDRVVPAHSYKFAAALQFVNDGPNPTLIRIETKAGHGAGKPTAMQIDEVADKFSFALYHMGRKK
jgi:prolyl oligopeptidase